MATEKPFTDLGSNRLSPVVDDSATLLVGSGIDASAAGALTIGATNATSVVMGAPVTFDTAQTGSVQTRTLTLGHAALTDADGSQTISIGAALPANAMILGVNVALATPFTGGGAGSVLLDIGSSGDADAIVANANLFAAAVDGCASAFSDGIAPNKIFTSSTQLTATVDADVNVADLTAGAATITVSFFVLP